MLKVGVVGCGGMGVWHLKKYSELLNVKIVAACEINQALLKKAAEEYKVPNLFTDYRKMAKIEDLDAVSIVLPNFLHTPSPWSSSPPEKTSWLKNRWRVPLRKPKR